MPGTTKALTPPGALYEQAGQFRDDLGTMQQAAVDQVLAAHAQVYEQVREDYQAVLEKIAAAQQSGEKMSPAWLYQRTRLKQALATTKVEIAKFAEHASDTAKAAQWAAVQASVKHAAKMSQTALDEAGVVSASFLEIDPVNLEHLVGFLHDGTPLDNLLSGLDVQVSDSIRRSLIRGIGLGKGVDWMRRQVEQSLDMPRWRAETIVRTESHRAYRAAARETYQANADVLAGWTWVATLDARVCPACLVMDGTEHPVHATLDGHPNCRCAMVPRTVSWADLGPEFADLEDTRPPVRSGKEWLAAQPPSVQRAILGPGKWKAWKDGQIGLDDVVARTHDHQWGTMRRERSLREIGEGLNGNYADAPHVPPVPVEHVPNPAVAAQMQANFDVDTLEAMLAESTDGQHQANLKAALAMHLNEQDYGPVLPGPDADKAAKATAKMNQAVISKGYPSKGYSQTQAIYKSQANGQVGTQVGVVKSLTWEQKITAQKALEDHQAWLADWLEGQAKSKGQAKALASVLAQDLDDAEHHGDVEAALAKAKGAVAALPPGPERDRYEQHVQAKADGYAAQVDQAKTWASQGGTWTNGDGSSVVIGDDGWGVLHPSTGGEQTLTPGQVNAILSGDEWKPYLEPEPAKVAQMVKAMQADEEGYLDPAFFDFIKGHLEDPGKGNPQMKANQAEALKQAEATLLPPPEPEAVQTVMDLANNDAVLDTLIKTYEDALKGDTFQPVEGTTLQQIKSNAKATLKALKDKKAQGSLIVDPDDETLADSVFGFPKDPNWPPPDPGSVATKVAHLNGSQGEQYLASYKEDLGPGDFLTPQGQSNTWHALKEWRASQGKSSSTPTQAAPEPPPEVPQAPSASAPFGAAPDPSTLRYTGQTLGTHGAKVYEGPNGQRWLYKPPKDPRDQFLVDVDEAASILQARAGLKAPDTFVVEIDGKRGSIQRMFDAQPAFAGGFQPAALSQADLLAVQQQHVLDWLLSNHDGHVEQFLRLPNGELVGIDKGQAFRWMGQDRLDWEFHPNSNYGAPPPVYNALWREFAKGGSVEVLDPRQGALAEFITGLQNMDDDEFRALFRGYAEKAAARGLLAVPQPQFPGVKVPPGGLPTNDPDAFLDLLVARKNGLADDFAALWDRAAKERKKNDPTWKPSKPAATKAKRARGKTDSLKGAPAPAKPEPPKAPEEQAAKVFDGWLAKAEARYQANPNKAKANLEATANWARFVRVMQDLDRNAVAELHQRQYLDDDLRDEALRLIGEAEEVKARAKAAFDQAQADYERAMERWRADTKAWREANGIVLTFAGMDEDVLRHGKDRDGMDWAKRVLDVEKITGKARDSLRDYTGSGYSTWNGQLRRSDGDPGNYAASIKAMDKAMTPIPEDVILHRGTGADAFVGVDGRRFSDSDLSRLTELVGTVQTDAGFHSVSGGNSAGFYSKPVQVKIRTPAGTPAAFAMPFSSYRNEREIVLARGLKFYVHAAYKVDYRWVLEVEIVPDDYEPPTDSTGKPLTSPSATPWTRLDPDGTW